MYNFKPFLSVHSKMINIKSQDMKNAKPPNLLRFYKLHLLELHLAVISNLIKIEQWNWLIFIVFENSFQTSKNSKNIILLNRNRTHYKLEDGKSKISEIWRLKLQFPFYLIFMCQTSTDCYSQTVLTIRLRFEEKKLVIYPLAPPLYMNSEWRWYSKYIRSQTRDFIVYPEFILHSVELRVNLVELGVYSVKLGVYSATQSTLSLTRSTLNWT
jgi:hypothetical protein